MQATSRICVQAEPFDTAEEIDRLQESAGDVGAIVTFSGICRDEEGTLAALELEHYPGMAETELRRIADDAGSARAEAGGHHPPRRQTGEGTHLSGRPPVQCEGRRPARRIQSGEHRGEAG